MKLTVTFDIPKEANKWLQQHSHATGTKQEWENIIHALLTAFLGDIQSEYAPDIAITKLHDGSYECSTIHNGYRAHHRYFGFSRRECLRLFREYLKTLE